MHIYELEGRIYLLCIWNLKVAFSSCDIIPSGDVLALLYRRLFCIDGQRSCLRNLEIVIKNNNSSIIPNPPCPTNTTFKTASLKTHKAWCGLKMLDKGVEW